MPSVSARTSWCSTEAVDCLDAHAGHGGCVPSVKGKPDIIGANPRGHPDSAVRVYHDGMSAKLSMLVEDPAIPERLTVSLKTLAKLLDAHRSSVRRWLGQAGIRPISLGRGHNGAIRYRWSDVQNWLRSQDYVQ